MAGTTPAKLVYATYEPKDGSVNNMLSPVIFLHGLCETKEHWDDVPQIVADQTKRMCFAIDARNHGDSEYTKTFNFDANTVDLLHFLDSIEVSKAILVGYSMGGCTAIGAALAKPEKVEKIVSVDMHTKKFDKQIADLVAGSLLLWRTAVHQLPKDLTMEEAITRAIDYMFSKLPPNMAIPSKDQMRATGKNIIQNSDGTFDVKYNKQAVMEAFKKPEVIRSECRGRFEGPALFMCGGLSPFRVSKEKANITKHFPNADFVEFKGATHTIPYEYPEQFLRTLMKFLLE